MDELHINSICDKNFFEPKKGQRDLMCSNKESHRCPFLDYKYVASLENNVDKAFDILFEEVIKIDYGKE